MVELIDITENPVTKISLAAGMCYGKENESEKRVYNCVKEKHTSVLEHAYVTFKITDVSRVFLAQLTRHRLASYNVESQRYKKYKFTEGDNSWYIMPQVYLMEDKYSGLKDRAVDLMQELARLYNDSIDAGIKAEDARFFLPEAKTTSITITMNYRELFNILTLRTSKSAQWEIRNVAKEMCELVENYNEQNAFIIGLWHDFFEGTIN